MKNPRRETDLAAAIRENLSPQAVAAIVAYLQPVATRDLKVNQQVAWFGEQLVDALGGHEQVGRLMDELGL